MSSKTRSVVNNARLLLRTFLFVLVAIVASLAAVENTQVIRLSLLGYESPELNLFWWLLIVLAIGIIIGRVTRAKTNR